MHTNYLSTPAVKSDLEKKGVLDEVRARLMAEILYSLTEEVRDSVEGV